MPAPNRGLMPAPNRGLMPAPNRGLMSAPNRGLMPAPNRGLMPAPNRGLMPAPNRGLMPAPNQLFDTVQIFFTADINASGDEGRGAHAVFPQHRAGQGLESIGRRENFGCPVHRHPVDFIIVHYNG